jgi:hypothetical protein
VTSVINRWVVFCQEENFPCIILNSKFNSQLEFFSSLLTGEASRKFHEVSEGEPCSREHENKDEKEQVVCV